MTREEFEAVLAVEGKFIKVGLSTPAGRFHPTYRNKSNTYFRAVVWEWVDMPVELLKRRRLLSTLPPLSGETQRMQFTLGVTNWEKTNHKAIKHLMKAWEKGLF